MSQTLENDPTDPAAFFQGNIPGFKSWKQKMERHYLKQIIAATNGDVKRILDLSGLSKSQFLLPN